MKKTFSIVIVLLAISCFFFYGKLTAQKNLQTDLSLKYLVQEPRIKSANPPVIILLHGYGSNEADLFALRIQLPPDFLIVSARAPISIGANSFEWFKTENVNSRSDSADASLDNSSGLIDIFIKEIIKKYHADAGRVYLSGFSQGAIMSYEVGLCHPELLKGIAPLSGKILEHLKPRIKVSAALQQLRIFIGHGTADNRIPYISATEAESYLKEMKLNVSFHSYNGMGHAINAEEMKDLMQWLMEN